MTPARNVDFLIVGGGLAGTVIARVLRLRERSVCVIDTPNPSSATRVAAGILNPVTGKNFVVTRDWDLYIGEAEPFYREWERDSGCRFFFPMPIHRFFAGPAAEEVFERKRSDAVIARHTGVLSPGPAERECLRAGLRGFTIRGGGCVDTRVLLDAAIVDLRMDAAFREDSIDYNDLRIESGSVCWKEIRAKKIIFCEGWRAARNPWFSWLPYRHAKGEILSFAGSPGIEAILNQGKWFAPFPDRSRAGATYEWNDLTETPTSAGRTEILNGLSGFLREVPAAVEHQAGIRPIVSGSLPVVGIHPVHQEIAILNGLGSKGLLWAPRLARQLADCLEGAGGIDPAIDVRRNL